MSDSVVQSIGKNCEIRRYTFLISLLALPSIWKNFDQWSRRGKLYLKNASTDLYHWHIYDGSSDIRGPFSLKLSKTCRITWKITLLLYYRKFMTQFTSEDLLFYFTQSGLRSLLRCRPNEEWKMGFLFPFQSGWARICVRKSGRKEEFEYIFAFVMIQLRFVPRPKNYFSMVFIFQYCTYYDYYYYHRRWQSSDVVSKRKCRAVICIHRYKEDNKTYKANNFALVAVAVFFPRILIPVIIYTTRRTCSKNVL